VCQKWFYTFILYVVRYFKICALFFIRVFGFLIESKHTEGKFECVIHHAREFNNFLHPEYQGPKEIIECDPDY
jgi:hypothetical protein